MTRVDRFIIFFSLFPNISRSDRSSNSDDYSGSELSTQRSDRSSPERRRGKSSSKRSTVKLKDGTVLDLTPPEELLPRVEKKAAQHVKYEEVSGVLFFLFKNGRSLMNDAVQKS